MVTIMEAIGIIIMIAIAAALNPVMFIIGCIVILCILCYKIYIYGFAVLYIGFFAFIDAIIAAFYGLGAIILEFLDMFG